MSFTTNYQPPAPEAKGYLPEGRTGFGKMGRGDITRWSKGVSKPFGKARPNRNGPGCSCASMPEVGNVRHQFQPITSLRRLREFEEAKAELTKATKSHDPASVLIMGREKDESVLKAMETLSKRASAIDRTIGLGNNFAEFYADPTANLTNKVVEFAEAPVVKKEIKKTESDEPSWFNELKRQNQVSRNTISIK